MRTKVILICNECNGRNYHIYRNKASEDRLELRKYCPHCKKTTIHKETR
ncbi:MAG: 50S ribosomal protein L33 [Mycoplasmataceae bacterium]|nr:50S ribosomal protein L33 [Mycoplasmataceae bacterium]